MHLQNSVRNIFAQLSESLRGLSDEQYKQRSTILSNATIGQHVRHIIEMFICLNNGYEGAVVNYEKRKRDLQIEEGREFAIGFLHDIYEMLDKPDKPLMLEANFDELQEEVLQIPTNYYREIAYNLEHTIHHMALIRIGITDVANIQLPANFGVASSTVKYRESCAR
jgi:hypothetical protein